MAVTWKKLAYADDVSAEIDADIATHAGAADPHTGYQKESEKAQASGYAGLGAGGLVPIAQLASGVPDGTKYIRDDGTLVTPTGGVTDHGLLTGLADDDHTQYQKESEKAAASGYASLNASSLVVQKPADRLSKANFEITLNKLLKGAGAGADPTEIDVPALSSISKGETRDSTIASGSVSYTGYGFTPKALIVFFAVAAPVRGWGHAGADLSVGYIAFDFNAVILQGAVLLYTNTASGAGQFASVASYDADGFTLTWTKLGSPTGAIVMKVLALR